MPEGPEVETVRRGLLRAVGQGVEDVYVADHRKYNEHREKLISLVGSVMESVERYGKMMVFSFSGDREMYALNHLGMTGIWRIYPAGDEVTRDKHLKLVITTDEFQLHFVDSRTFGYFVPLSTRVEVESTPYISRLGPDILDDVFDVEEFIRRARGKNGRRRKDIGSVLLESSVVSGCGNIYKSESLFRAGIDPRRGVNTLSDHELRRIANHLCDVGQEALRSGGSTLRDFSNVEGYDGLMQNSFRVYGRGGEPCEVCGTLIEVAKLSGRSTFFCPRCQV